MFCKYNYLALQVVVANKTLLKMWPHTSGLLHNNSVK